LAQVEARHADPRDLVEAAQRIIATRQTRTVPPLAEIFKHLEAAKADRLRVEARDHRESLTAGMVRFGSFQQQEIRVWKELSLERNEFHCDLTGWRDGWCDCEPTCCGAGVSLADAKSRLEWARKNKAPKRPKPGSIGEVLSSVFRKEIPF
jgi:hypothetical protein